VNSNLLLSLIGTADVFVSRLLGTADGVQGCGGYTNGYGDVIGAVINVVGDGRKTVIPSEGSCQLLCDLCKAGAVVVSIADVGTRDNLGYGELDMTGGGSDGGGVGEFDVVKVDPEDGVNGGASITWKRL